MAATRVIYMEERKGQEPDPCYLKEFDAHILERGPDFVVLDQTLFYAEGGGQPCDIGILRWPELHGQGLRSRELEAQLRAQDTVGVEDKAANSLTVTTRMLGGTFSTFFGEARVLRVTKEKGVIRHVVDRMPSADDVHGVVDWERRYAHMRMHTSQHLMSGLVFRIFGARTVGNQIHADRSRIDFQPANFTGADLKRIEDACNEVIASSADVRIFEEDRVAVENRIEDRALMDLIPKSIRRLRIIQVGDADYCPCGGTHLKNVREIGRVHVLGKRSKGRDTDRVEYELLPA